MFDFVTVLTNYSHIHDQLSMDCPRLRRLPPEPVFVCHIAQAAQGQDQHPGVRLRFLLRTWHRVLESLRGRYCQSEKVFVPHGRQFGVADENIGLDFTHCLF